MNDKKPTYIVVDRPTGKLLGTFNDEMVAWDFYHGVWNSYKNSNEGLDRTAYGKFASMKKYLREVIKE